MRELAKRLTWKVRIQKDMQGRDLLLPPVLKVTMEALGMGKPT